MRRLPVIGVVSASAAVLLGWAYWALHSDDIASWWLHGADPTKAGVWGNSFGAFSALVSALGFAAVLATLWIQGAALRQQQTDQHQQRFESSFFELLALMREVRKEVRFRYSDEFVHDSPPNSKRTTTPSTGPEAIRKAIVELRYWMKREGLTGSNATKDGLANIYLKKAHGRFESTFGPYFRLIYTILDRVRTDPLLSDDDKAQYANLLRGQLTSHEISLVAINGLAPLAKDLSSLIVEFHLLKYLPTGTMRRALEQVYDPQAFAARDGSTAVSAPQSPQDPALAAPSAVSR